MHDGRSLWDIASSEIEITVSKANFSTWFRNTGIVRHDSDVVYLSVPNAFVKDWLANKYHKLILKALRNNVPTIKGVEYVIQKDDKPKEAPVRIPERDEAWGEQQMKFTELYVSPEDNLNPKYTFESFVVGPFNELAYAAAQAVIKNLGASYNPLFIYGGTGLGKTHLIQSLGNHLKKGAVGKKVLYITSERWASELVDSLQTNKMTNFKDKYRKYDLLIIDDIQFVAGKEKMQEELFHLFNSLYERNKQIVFSSDKPPKSIDGLEDRLRSRFEGGMIVDVAKPEYESRLAILKSKVLSTPFAPSDEGVEYIASVVQDNIRELEGVLKSIVMQSQLKNRTLNLAEIKLLIKDHTKPQRTVSIKDVIKTVSTFYNIEERMLYEKTRRKEVVKPRQIIMYILREDFNTSYPYIGQKLGGRDHTTVIHAYEKIKNDIKTNSLLCQELEQIKSLLFNNFSAA